MLVRRVRILPATEDGDLGFVLLSPEGHICWFYFSHSVLDKVRWRPLEKGPCFQGVFSPFGVTRLIRMTPAKNH